jgi:hypothetical protein
MHVDERAHQKIGPIGDFVRECENEWTNHEGDKNENPYVLRSSTDTSERINGKSDSSPPPHTHNSVFSYQIERPLFFLNIYMVLYMDKFTIVFTYIRYRVQVPAAREVFYGSSMERMQFQRYTCSKIMEGSPTSCK